MKLLQLEYFEAVCKYETINRAAESLHVSQPAVTKAIQQLESEFDVALFYRTGNHISLTREGEFFLRYATDITSRVRMLSNRMHEISKDTYSVRIGIPPMTGALMFSEIYHKVQQKFPELRLEVFENGSVMLADSLNDADNTLDMALVLADKDLSSQYNVLHIKETELVYCVSEKSEFANRKSVNICEIANHPLILMKKGSYQYDALNNLFSFYDVTPNIVLYSNQLITMTSMIRNNNASAFLLRELAEVQDGIIPIPLDEPLKISTNMVWSKHNHLSAHALKLIRFLSTAYNSDKSK